MRQHSTVIVIIFLLFINMLFTSGNYQVHTKQTVITPEKAAMINKQVEEKLPFDQEYEQLRKALFEYVEVKRKGGWPRIISNEVLKKGDKNKHVAVLRTRLQKEPQFNMDLKTDDESLFDDKLQQAVFNFQKRYGLTMTGTVGPQTKEILNLPVEYLIEKIIINLERLRKFDKELGEKYILVNIPAFELEVIEKGKTVLKSRTIVGKPSRPTPVFSTTITSLVLNPRWYIPQKIAVEDFLPRIKKDISYLDEENLKIYQKTESGFTQKDPEEINWEDLNENNFDYYIWQDEGPDNYLGKVIFNTPNSRDIYLHDTPEKDLFDRRLRIYSSGCVRVEKALELTDYLLRYSDEYSPEDAQKILKEGYEAYIPLDESITLHFVYLTSYINDNGRIQFHKDIYGKEEH